MTSIAKLYTRIRLNGRASFKDLRRIVEAFGFELKRTNGSHHIFQHPDVPGNLNLQSSGKDAKPYQIRQLLDMIDSNGLDMIEP
ncbi:MULTISPECIES: type II toxin-antitoxin system HicA family toxin [unclassified Sphingopyxis]|uniref:type II toxin-antitoxin system HicA family toxin n=1 Tax=unclassified Sphingopyxis TaxID=2614943 RepID=UPI0025D6EB4C|nr:MULTISPECIES: type II toxin-antitoxin system HicA family toxin [unclassified Sphingopyxis]